MIDYFGPFAIMKSLEHNNEVTEMYMQERMNVTGEVVVLSMHRAPGFEWCKFEALDAPEFSPAGSRVFLEKTGLDGQGFVAQTVVARGW